MAHPAPVASDPMLLTVVQAASALNVSERTIENLICRGELVSLRIGRCRRVTRDAVAAFVDRLITEQLMDVMPLNGHAATSRKKKEAPHAASPARRA